MIYHLGGNRKIAPFVFRLLPVEIDCASSRHSKFKSTFYAGGVHLLIAQNHLSVMILCNYLPGGLKIPSNFTKISVPQSTWAIFDVPGVELQSVWKRIWSEWFPTSEFEAIDGVQFEIYYGLANHKNGFVKKSEMLIQKSKVMTAFERTE